MKCLGLMCLGLWMAPIRFPENCDRVLFLVQKICFACPQDPWPFKSDCCLMYKTKKLWGNLWRRLGKIIITRVTGKLSVLWFGASKFWFRLLFTYKWCSNLFYGRLIKSKSQFFIELWYHQNSKSWYFLGIHIFKNNWIFQGYLKHKLKWGL